MSRLTCLTLAGPLHLGGPGAYHLPVAWKHLDSPMPEARLLHPPGHQPAPVATPTPIPTPYAYPLGQSRATMMQLLEESMRYSSSKEADKTVIYFNSGNEWTRCSGRGRASRLESLHSSPM